MQARVVLPPGTNVEIDTGIDLGFWRAVLSGGALDHVHERTFAARPSHSGSGVRRRE